jgi:hypothetical protein
MSAYEKQHDNYRGPGDEKIDECRDCRFGSGEKRPAEYHKTEQKKEQAELRHPEQVFQFSHCVKPSPD